MLVSKDARDAGASLLNLVENSREWKKDICTLALRIDSSNREQAELVRELCAHKLRTLKYPNSVIDAFEGIYVELIPNAFEHGLMDRWLTKGKIEIETEITNSYVALIVRNSKGVRFDFEKACETQYRLLTDNPQSRRGRGLLTVKGLADGLSAQENGRTIKAVLYRDCVKIDFFEFEKLVVFSLVSGIYNPSLPSRLAFHVRHFPGYDIILDFSRFRRRGSEVHAEVISLRERLAKANQRVVVICHPENIALSFDVDDVGGWHEALERLDRLDLLEELAQRGLR
ncbi:MAG: ATP-binding protein [Candidatus Binatia bacterium]